MLLEAHGVENYENGFVYFQYRLPRINKQQKLIFSYKCFCADPNFFTDHYYYFTLSFDCYFKKYVFIRT